MIIFNVHFCKGYESEARQIPPAVQVTRSCAIKRVDEDKEEKGCCLL
jgi:hypothetical protein